MLKPTSNPIAGALPTFAGLFGFAYVPSQANGIVPPATSRVNTFLQKLSGSLSVTNRAGAGYPNKSGEQNSLMARGLLGDDWDGTSLSGSPGLASPSNSGAVRTQQVWDRQALSAELWILYHTDGRFRQSVEKRVAKAVKPGFWFQCEPRDGTSARAAKQVQGEIDAMLRRTGLLRGDDTPNTEALANFLRGGLMEGDVFQQRVVSFDGEVGRVVALVPMPGPSMQKLTDDRGVFPDKRRAFVQMDSLTQQPVINADGSAAYFAAWQIGHYAWKRIGYDRYGQFEYATSREPARSLAVVEQSQENRRVGNGSRIKEHLVRTTDNGGELEKYIKANSSRNRAGKISTDPLAQYDEYFHNQSVELKVHDADPNLHEVQDLTYGLEKTQAIHGTPSQLLGMNLANVPRDTLQLILDEWGDERMDDLRWVLDSLLDLVRFQTLLLGQNPDAFKFSIAPALEAFANASEAVTFVTKAMSNVLGAGMAARPSPLITVETAVRILARWIGVQDAATYVQKLQDALEENHMDADTVHQQQMIASQPRNAAGPSGGVNNGAANPRSGGGQSGYGSKFEGGKRVDGGRSTGGDSYRK